MCRTPRKLSCRVRELGEPLFPPSACVDGAGFMSTCSCTSPCETVTASLRAACEHAHREDEKSEAGEGAAVGQR